MANEGCAYPLGSRVVTQASKARRPSPFRAAAVLRILMVVALTVSKIAGTERQYFGAGYSVGVDVPTRTQVTTGGLKHVVESIPAPTLSNIA